MPTHLRNDWQCMSDMVRQSVGPYNYQVNSVIKERTCPISECNTSFHMGAKQADVFSALRNSNPTRVYTRGRVSTSLYGTAPLKRMGDGIMYNVDGSTQLRDGFGIPLRCVRPETEKLWDRMDYIDVPTAVEANRRGGESTRFVPVWTAPTRAATPVPTQIVQ